ncbi:MAG: M24 family metallopeptidase [Alphaproteobacteria bacterium]|nr:M24 family metallopeptidase [Alphaproteobacteria bacterium]
MAYKGDANLEKLLKDAGETRPLDAVKATLRGVLAAPEDIAAPDLWLTLFKAAANKNVAEQLTALKNQLAAETSAPQQDRLAALRAEMKRRNIEGFYIPRADEFHGEYVPARSERLKWATGFTGSAGVAVVLEKKAGFFTDGRYTLAARKQVNKKDFDICSTAADQQPTPTMRPTEWIEKNLPKGASFGIDPWIMSANEVKAVKDAVDKAGGILVYVDSNPLDAAWQNRPAAPVSPAVPQPLEYAGKSSEDKRDDLADVLSAKGADALAIALPEETCWLLNVRGGDVPCTPFALSYAIAHKDGSVDWYIDRSKVTGETQKWIGADVRLHDIAEFENGLKALGKQGKTVWVDPNTAPVKVQNTVADNGGKVVSERSPLQLMKALKNDVEIEGMTACHIRDGAALTRFLAAVSEQGAAAKYDEISASDLLQKFRAENDKFRGLSFDTISGAGGNGAIIHYHSTPATSQKLDAGPVYLVDSGAQYLDGTTDITRAIALSPPTGEMKENFTRVLKGHIQVAMAEFPAGTTGDKLDEKARAALKSVGLDYAHGTGHGVGSYLSVHEGPCSISSANTTVPMQAGMILSNEPGYYKEGAYGIRIESLVVVVDTGRKDKEGRDLLAFKTLTMAPIDRNLVDAALLTPNELKWLNDYHAEVRKNLLPLLQKADPKAADFLKRATAPIKKPPPQAKKAMRFFF